MFICIFSLTGFWVYHHKNMSLTVINAKYTFDCNVAEYAPK